LDRTEKREFIAHLATVFADTSFVLVAQNKGLTVAEVSNLRRRMRDAGATYKVAKNRLATLALDGTRFGDFTRIHFWKHRRVRLDAKRFGVAR